MVTHRRRLPHLYPDAADLFVTWSLHGVLPANFSARPGKLSAGEAFVWMDRQLDTVRSGPMYLRQAPIAQLVVGSIYKGEQLGHYELRAYVVMANRLLGRTGEPFWQKESYDHWVRNEAEFSN